jgi:hypothetical protein
MLMRTVTKALSFGSIVGLTACVGTAPSVPASREPMRVSNNSQPFQMWDGALARKAADAACGGKVKVSIYDRFDRATGEWVYPEGCT